MSEPTSASAGGEPVWDQVILPERGLFDIQWRELWKYRDLIAMLAQRDISASYKQTVLGPFWFVLQPILVTAVFSYLFGRMGRFGTDDVPHYLFYMSGLVAWGFFSESVLKTSSIFTQNQHLFGKVYFPRLAVPIAGVLTNLLPLAVQMSSDPLRTFLIAGTETESEMYLRSERSRRITPAVPGTKGAAPR